MWCTIKLSKYDSLLLGVCYRAPGSSHDYVKLNDLLKMIPQVHMKNVIVMGDFNFAHIDWESGAVDGPEDSDQSQFLKK